MAFICLIKVSQLQKIKSFCVLPVSLVLYIFVSQQISVFQKKKELNCEYIGIYFLFSKHLALNSKHCCSISLCELKLLLLFNVNGKNAEKREIQFHFFCKSHLCLKILSKRKSFFFGFFKNILTRKEEILKTFRTVCCQIKFIYH